MTKRVLGLVLLVSFGACGTLGEDIRGKDRGVVLPAARLVAPLLEPAVAPEDRPRRVRGILGIEFAGDYATGAFVQQQGVVQQRGFVTDYTMWQASIAARGGVAVRDQLRVEGIGGVGWHDARFEFNGNSGRVRADESGPGPLLGVQLTWEPLAWGGL